MLAFYVLVAIGGSVVTSLGEESSVDAPDLEVGGFTVFGTNTTGATTVTSGWGSVYMDGSLQVGSNLVVNGSITSTNLIQANRVGLSGRDQYLAEGATIQPAGSYIRVRGSTAPVSLGNPQIAAGTPGQLITLQGTATLLQVKLVNGNGLRTKREQSFSLGEYDTIQFIYDESSSNWVEITRSNNRWNP